MTTLHQYPLSPEKKKEALRIATQLHSQSPDWLTFFREVLGIGGVARRLFTTQEEFLAFEKSAEYSEIQKLVSNLRAFSKNPSAHQEPTKVITVRLPKSLHEALRAEAHDHKTSMNKLCISKLLQVLAEEEAMSQAKEAASNPRKAEPTQFTSVNSFDRRDTQPINPNIPIATKTPTTSGFTTSQNSPQNTVPAPRTYSPQNPNGF